MKSQQQQQQQERRQRPNLEDHLNPQPPFVVACGYRRIHIPKTNNTFPALLICLPPSSAANKCPLLVWRSKKDFLLLSRCVRSKGTQNQPKTPFFPKAAFKRLVQEDIVPWSRPLGSILLQPTFHSINSFIESIANKTNHYEPKMKKSLHQLDSFLLSIWRDLHQSTTDTLSSAIALSETWEIFCRPENTDHLIDIAATPTQTPTQLSSRLGQYFASRDNAKQVVQIALQRILLLLKNSSSFALFVEPSCGHGDIVFALIQAFKEHKIPPHKVIIRGYDIDGSAINTCKKRSEFSPSHCDYARCIQWIHGDFLKTKRVNITDNDGRQIEDLVICCLGGPPYTTGAGSGSAILRDLPTRFVDHCQHEWQADNVTFLLPVRYRSKERQKEVQCANSTSIWKVETFNLSSSTFFFQGNEHEQVTQPSIIQSHNRLDREATNVRR